MVTYTVRYTAELKEILTQQTTGHVPYIAPVGSFILINDKQFKVLGILYAPAMSHIEVILQ